MKSILVTGGTGTLGRLLVPRLLAAGRRVRLMSRRPRSANDKGEYEWAQASLTDGAGLEAAVKGVDVIIHLATNPKKMQAVEVEGTARLLQAAVTADVAHFVYVSIIGIDRIPFSLFRYKVAAEEHIINSGVPWTILRAPLFYPLLDTIMHKLAKLPVLLLPAGFLWQPIDPDEIAMYLAAFVSQPSGGRLSDFGGPQILTPAEVVRTWLRVKGLRRLVVELPIPGRIAAAYRAGYNTSPDTLRAKVSWADWLHRQYSPALAQAIA